MKPECGFQWAEEEITPRVATYKLVSQGASPSASRLAILTDGKMPSNVDPRELLSNFRVPRIPLHNSLE